MLTLFKKMILAASILFLSACQPHDKDKNVLKVGTIAGPETELMVTAKAVAKKEYNLDIKIIEFTDYLQPNAALSDGSIDANMFQHQPYLDQQIKDKDYPIVTVAKTFVYPMGIYSEKIKSLKDIPVKSSVAIPNDPSNEGRALLLLQKANLIQLKPDKGLFATPHDILLNPKQLQFKELDASQVARTLPDVDIALINTNYAVAAGLSPTKDAVFLEDKDSPYANIVVVRKQDVDDPKIKQLIDALQSEAVLETAEKLFNHQAIPAWK